MWRSKTFPGLIRSGVTWLSFAHWRVHQNYEFWPRQVRYKRRVTNRNFPVSKRATFEIHFALASRSIRSRTKGSITLKAHDSRNHPYKLAINSHIRRSYKIASSLTLCRSSQSELDIFFFLLTLLSVLHLLLAQYKNSSTILISLYACMYMCARACTHTHTHTYTQNNLILRFRYLSRFISFSKFNNPFSLSSCVTDAFLKELKECVVRSMLYGNSLHTRRLNAEKLLFVFVCSQLFLLFVDVIHRMHVISFGGNPRAGSAVLIIMDCSYYGPYIAGETGSIPHRDELSIYYSPWSFLGINNRDLLRTGNPVTLWINLRRLNRRIAVKC